MYHTASPPASITGCTRQSRRTQRRAPYEQSVRPKENACSQARPSNANEIHTDVGTRALLPSLSGTSPRTTNICTKHMQTRYCAGIPRKVGYILWRQKALLQTVDGMCSSPPLPSSVSQPGTHIDSSLTPVCSCISYPFRAIGYRVSTHMIR